MSCRRTKWVYLCAEVLRPEFAGCLGHISGRVWCKLPVTVDDSGMTQAITSLSVAPEHTFDLISCLFITEPEILVGDHREEVFRSQRRALWDGRIIRTFELSINKELP